MDELFRTIAFIGVSFLLLLAGYYGSYYLIFKKKLSEFSACLDAVDDALKDDKVSNEEFSMIWDRCYLFFKNLRG